MQYEKSRSFFEIFGRHLRDIGFRGLYSGKKNYLKVLKI